MIVSSVTGCSKYLMDLLTKQSDVVMHVIVCSNTGLVREGVQNIQRGGRGGGPSILYIFDGEGGWPLSVFSYGYRQFP